MLLFGHVKLAKLLQPVGEELSGDFGLLQLLLGYEKIEFFFAVFQLGQFGLEGLGCKAVHDDIDNVINSGFGFPKLLFKQRQVGRFFILEAHEAGNNGFNGRIVHQHGSGLVNDEIFNPVLFDSFLLAVIELLFDCVAFVIAVNGAIAALATLTVHGCSTMTTEQLGGQEIQFTMDGKTQMVQKDSTKTKSSCRTLPLVAPFEVLLRYLKAEQALNQKVCGDCYCTDYLDYIYVDAMGGLIKPNFITQHFDLLLKKQGLKKIRFHDLRHSCASLLYANGVPLKDIQEWLGHSDIGTTSNIYTHLDYSNKVSSANAILGVYPNTFRVGAVGQ